MELPFEFKDKLFDEEADDRNARLNRQMHALTEYHRAHCAAYARMLDAAGYDGTGDYTRIPALPVSLFKEMRLSSLGDDADYKTVTSSGTSGQQTSQIILDADTRTLQQQVLAQIGGDFLGGKRLPMLVIDCEATVKKRDHFSARTSAILGFSLFGTHRTFALREDMTLDTEALCAFLEKYGDAPFLIFGFTFMVWQYFVQAIEESGLEIDCSRAVLLHGGGWKKLIDQAVSKETFRERLHSLCGIGRVIDYYGMAEQTGTIYMECECGHLHASDYSQVLIRNPQDFSLCEPGETGLIQVMSLIPRSYPGHNLLTEDEGRILGIDDCPCGRKGTYFEVLGRVKNAELRGCSDTFAEGREVLKDLTASQENKRDVYAQNCGDVFGRPVYLIGNADSCKNIRKNRPYVPFSKEAMDFLSAVSGELFADKKTLHAYPDLAAFAFWCRRGHLEQMARNYAAGTARIGRRVSLHFAPGNIPLIFAFTMAAGLLSGTSVIVRLPGRTSLQEQAVIEAIGRVLRAEAGRGMSGRIVLCRYGHEKAVTDALSALCDVRVIWGADASVRKIRSSPLPPRAIEVPFATRYSLALFDADYVADEADIGVLARDFYNDTYLNDQNACSSPRILCWMGEIETAISARERFWNAIEELLDERFYALQAETSVKKADAALRIAASCPGSEISGRANDIVRIHVPRLMEELWQISVPGGFFIETLAESIEEIEPVLGETCQTVAVSGIEPEELSEALIRMGAAGADRIVPVGHTLDFSLTWDGFDLIETLSRRVSSRMD